MSVYTDILKKHNDIMQKVWGLQVMESMNGEEAAHIKNWLQKKHPDIYDEWCEHRQHYVNIIDEKTATVKIKRVIKYHKAKSNQYGSSIERHRRARNKLQEL